MCVCSPETLGEAEPDSRMLLKALELFGDIFNLVATVVKLRAGGVGVNPLMVHLVQRDTLQG
jgi:hypothetical protein